MLLSQFFQRASKAKQAAAGKALQQLCARLLSEGGASNSAPIAAQITQTYDALGDESRLAFFQYLDTALGLDPQQVLAAATRYAEQPDAERLLGVQRATEPPRQELLRRINRVAGGTAAIVEMRRDLLKLLGEHPELRAVDSDFVHLLSSWFNPGFLVMRRVDWESPAALLEKIIRHEAVHAIKGWTDLRRRLQSDRRCFGFFHPQLPGEPLIFVEVALLHTIPRSIGQLIGEEASDPRSAQPRVAAFYSISNCEPGLRGVSLGNFLIKRVADELRRDLPSLRRFCTLSPIPSFRAWLAHLDTSGSVDALPAGARGALATVLSELRGRYGSQLDAIADAVHAKSLPDEDQMRLMQSAATFLAYESVTPRGDAVARFHLDNGARLERVNVNADPSPKGLRESFGVMVNYLYDLDAIEANHERFVGGEVVRSRRLGEFA
jgi:malonyl-CoA decarboxylase